MGERGRKCEAEVERCSECCEAPSLWVGLCDSLCDYDRPSVGRPAVARAALTAVFSLPQRERQKERRVHSSWSSDTRNFLFLSAPLPGFPRNLPSTMTLLASERSLLIRNKFRSVRQESRKSVVSSTNEDDVSQVSELKTKCIMHSGKHWALVRPQCYLTSPVVLQLRIQNRRQSEINADSGLKPTAPTQKSEKDQSEALRLNEDGTTQKLPPSGLNTKTTQVERSVFGAQRQKKARLAQDLTERIHCQPGPVEQQHQHTLPLENRSASFLSALMSSKMTSPPAPPPRPPGNMAFTNHRPTLLYQGSQATNY
ncbi:unnamed protein product [Pleuronectes platessa]|uniref:Uncharacterized protein n=1 Tax=Pleuronectes platessa TaxID=8262 RepID=A0A9N7VFG9_PLEPL|nr:unnamed protein product [Pleuronectes platessa]